VHGRRRGLEVVGQKVFRPGEEVVFVSGLGGFSFSPEVAGDGAADFVLQATADVEGVVVELLERGGGGEEEHGRK